jgi:hypothetical protein
MGLRLFSLRLSLLLLSRLRLFRMLFLPLPRLALPLLLVELSPLVRAATTSASLPSPHSPDHTDSLYAAAPYNPGQSIESRSSRSIASADAGRPSR